MDVDDDFALLAFAKKRLAEQQEKEDQQAKEAEEEEDEDDEEEEDNEEEEDDEDDDSPVATDPVNVDESVAESSNDEQPKSFIVEETPVQEEKKEDSVVAPTDTPSAPRRERDENAELWALLRQSKSRIELTKSMVEEVEKVDDGSEAKERATDRDEALEGEDDASEGEDATSEGEDDAKPAASASGYEDDEKEEETKRDFEQENRELWALLQKSKSRLEETALAKMKEAEKAAAADDELPPPRAANPYKDIDAVPDHAESDDVLTQKELLLAMAVAEEASRSGKEVFTTPLKEELRNRDIQSFDFLKEQQTPKVPETAIRNDAKEEERERSRFAHLSQTLGSRWTNFKKRINEIDEASRHTRPGQ